MHSQSDEEISRKFDKFYVRSCRCSLSIFVDICRYKLSIKQLVFSVCKRPNRRTGGRKHLLTKRTRTYDTIGWEESLGRNLPTRVQGRSYFTYNTVYMSRR